MSGDERCARERCSTEWESAGERDCLYKDETHLRKDTSTVLQVRIKQQELRLDYFIVVLYIIKSLILSGMLYVKYFV